jgi:antitoxin YqcF
MTRPEPARSPFPVAQVLTPFLTTELRTHGTGKGTVVEAERIPHPTLSTYLTVSLHEVPNLLEGKDIRVELVAVGASGDPRFARMLGEAAEHVANDHWLAAPGVVFPDLIDVRSHQTAVRHVMWTEAFDLPELAQFVVEGVGVTVYGLQAVPITEAERTFLLREGFWEFEALLEAADAAHYDLDRESIV